MSKALERFMSGDHPLEEEIASLRARLERCEADNDRLAKLAHDARSELEAVIAAYDAAPGNQNHVWIRAAIDAYEKALWRPVAEEENLPDGTRAWLWQPAWPEPALVERRVYSDESFWVEMDTFDRLRYGTHFRLLPAPPEVT